MNSVRIEEYLIDQTIWVRYNLSALIQSKCMHLSFNKTRKKCRKERTNQKNDVECVFMGSVPACNPVEDGMSSNADGRKAVNGWAP
jgi:hypothetical protein